MHLGLKAKDYGNCVVAQNFDGTLTVERADPRILISAELLNIVRNLDRVDWMHPGVALVGDVLTIDGSNQTVVYRIGEKVPDRYAYYAEWPD
ncbi:hypothetical protein [Acrocarpospora sp. B8E8]|uniref:hypothetical protein n=1 Tax=Acrocarpospora sp. B8E8 TaxID=3153572 RepID=UPI00325F808E